MKPAWNLKEKTAQSIISSPTQKKVLTCDCEKYNVLLRPSDLWEPRKSWIRTLVEPCQHLRRNQECSCDLVINLPYGYFFHVDRHLELGDTIGPNSTYVRIISKDKFRFIIKRKWTKNCLLIDSWFKNKSQTPQGEEAEIFIKKYPSICIHYMCLFLMYKHDYENGTSLPDKNFTVPDQLVFQMIELANDFIL